MARMRATALALLACMLLCQVRALAEGGTRRSEWMASRLTRGAALHAVAEWRSRADA
jgi:hypothetical protein